MGVYDENGQLTTDNLGTSRPENVVRRDASVEAAVGMINDEKGECRIADLVDFFEDDGYTQQQIRQSLLRLRGQGKVGRIAHTQKYVRAR